MRSTSASCEDVPRKGPAAATKKSVAVMLISLSALGLLTLTACDSSKPKAAFTGPTESFTLAITKAFQLSSLIVVAKERGYFADQGLDVTFKISESGHIAVEELLAGSADLATASEFVVVSRLRDRPDLRIISTLDKAIEQQLVARKDRGIAGPQDLTNKRIGVARGSSSEYYLNVFLILHGIPFEKVYTVGLLPSQQVKAIVAGDIDALMVWEPFASIAKEKLAGNGKSWSVPGAQREYWLLLGTEKTIEKRAPVVRRILAALASAEEFMEKNRDEVFGLVESKLEDRRMGDLWTNHDFRLGLDRPLAGLPVQKRPDISPRKRPGYALDLLTDVSQRGKELLPVQRTVIPADGAGVSHGQDMRRAVRNQTTRSLPGQGLRCGRRIADDGGLCPETAPSVGTLSIRDQGFKGDIIETSARDDDDPLGQRSEPGRERPQQNIEEDLSCLRAAKISRVVELKETQIGFDQIDEGLGRRQP